MSHAGSLHGPGVLETPGAPSTARCAGGDPSPLRDTAVHDPVQVTSKLHGSGNDYKHTAKGPSPGFCDWICNYRIHMNNA